MQIRRASVCGAAAGSAPKEPVQVHPLAGQSRSSAFVLGAILIEYIQSGFGLKMMGLFVAHAADLLVQIRRQSSPNGLLLQLCAE